MARRWSSIGIACLLATVFLAAAPSSAPASHEPIRQLVLPGPQSFATTDGNWLVWLGGDSWSQEQTVHAMRLATRETTTLMSGPGLRFISGLEDGTLLVANCDDPERGHDAVFCPDPYDLIRFDLDTMRRDELAGVGPGSFSGDLVVWATGGGGEPYTLLGRDIVTMDDPFAIAERDVAYIFGVVLEGERLIWEEVTDQDSAVSEWRIMTMMLGETEPRPLRVGRVFGWTYSGGWLAFVDDTGITARNLNSGAEHRIDPPSAVGSASGLTTDGRYLFWGNYVETGDVHQRRVDVWGHELTTQTTFPAIHDGGMNDYFVARAGMLVWTHGFEDSQHGYPAATDIAISPISGLLPNHSPADPDWLHFPESGYYLKGLFRETWERAGGMPLLGYPVTEEFGVLNDGAELGKAFQWTERARLEWHPELSGTPYEVQLGLLGWEEVNRRLIWYYDAFHPISAYDPQAIDPDCLYVSETDHQICGAFLVFWESNGLDFGDSGVSFRESLALFGYPISEEFNDIDSISGVGTHVQFFERVRLEYHPDNPAGQQVQISRIGAVMERWRGW